MAVTFSTGPGGELLCAFIEGLEELVEATFTPELLGEEQYLDEEISTLLAHCPGVDPFSTKVIYADDELCRYILRGGDVLYWRLIQLFRESLAW